MPATTMKSSVSRFPKTRISGNYHIILVILRIIVAVSTGENVPPNKGFLYDTFITALIKLDPIINHPVPVEIRIDIL